jgi:hypothetical protein
VKRLALLDTARSSREVARFLLALSADYGIIDTLGRHERAIRLFASRSDLEMARRNYRKTARRLNCERLESRCLLSVLHGDGDFHAVIVAGDPKGSPADSPSNRVDDNTTSSPFAGVGSLQINANRGTYICTATPIVDAKGDTKIVSAGHCLDLNGDGKSDKKDGIKAVYFNLNYGGTLTHQIQAASWMLHPDYTGFARPSVNDDLSVTTLVSPLPAGVPAYALPSSDPSNDLAAGTTLIMVGYGRSGNGISGYTTNADFAVKRVGENNADAFYSQDDTGKPAASEVFRFDFDGPTGTGTWGGGTLGNDQETTLGGGDSGGPSFKFIGDPSNAGSSEIASNYVLVGVNTFTQGANAPKFGSLGGGINIHPYLNWITSGIVDTSTGGGGNVKTGTAQLNNLLAISGEIVADAHLGHGAWSTELPDSRSSVAVSETHSVTSVVVQQPSDQSDWFVNHVMPPTGITKRDPLGLTSAEERIGDKQNTADDLIPAVDEVLSRWTI